jgi:hypothetical protein
VNLKAYCPEPSWWKAAQHLQHFLVCHIREKGKVVNPDNISMTNFLGSFEKKNIFDVPGKAARDADTWTEPNYLDATG